MEKTVKTFTAFLAAFLFFVVPSFSSDPDPLQDFCVANLTAVPLINGFPCKPAADVTAADFFFSGFTKPGDTSNPNGLSVTTGNVLDFPAVNTLGISMNHVELAPGGVNPPHSHPRATESGFVIEGTVLVGFVSTNNILYSKVLYPREMFVIPRGLVHFQRNVGNGTARLVTAFNSQLPGVIILPNTVFGSNPPIPNEVLTKAFRTDDSVVNSIKSKFAT